MTDRGHFEMREAPAFVFQDLEGVYTMGAIQYGEHDNSVVEELRKLPDGTTTGDIFDRALELGATPALLGGIASGYLAYDTDDPYAVVGLPYVNKLLAAGWEAALVRDFLHDQCFNPQHDMCSYHRQAVTLGAAWELFDLKGLIVFLKEIAATYEGRHFLTPEGRDNLMIHLHMARDDDQQDQRDIRAVEAVAASHLTYIAEEYQLRKMIQHAVPRKPRDQQIMAYHVQSWGWGLVFKGYVLAKHGSQGYEASLVIQDIRDKLDRTPEQAVQVYRWLMEGFWRADNRFWMFRAQDSYLRQVFEYLGWQFLPLTITPQGNLQVKLASKGALPRIVRHVPGNEELQTGDEVMIHPSQLKDLKPSFQPGGQVYRLTLTPACRPTAEQLADIHGQFPTLTARRRTPA